MKNIIIGTVLASFLWSCQSSSQGKEPMIKKDSPVIRPVFTPLSETEKKKYHDEVEFVLNHSLLRGSFNGGILVAKNGTVVYERYVGFHDLRQKDSLHADVPFQIASTSKTMTGAAVLQLAQQGKLSLDDSLQKFFPGFPYEGITVKLLLNHRSGLPNYLNYMEHGNWPRKQLATNQDVLTTLMTWKPPHAYQPDRHFNYCNTNYVLLALIIEKASGQSYPDYMKEHIFAPLGMTSTFVVRTGDSLVTQSYQPNGALWTLDFSDGPYGDKNVYSTPRDLLKWDQALYEGKVINKAMLDSAFQPYSNEKPGVHNYGLGWRMLLFPQKKVIYHNGHWHGFNSAFARLVDEGATVIILSNKYNTNVYTSAKKLYEVFGNYSGRRDEGEE